MSRQYNPQCEIHMLILWDS